MLQPILISVLRTILIAGAIISQLPASLARADERPSYSVRDNENRILERLERQPDGSYVRRDPSGSRQGTADPALGGGFTLRDKKGTREGYVSETPWGGYTIRDNSGMTKQRVEPTPYGDYVVRDSAGKRVGTIKRER